VVTHGTVHKEPNLLSSDWRKTIVNKGLIANASIFISATAAKVWNALTNPELIRQYMFGTNVVSDWREGSPIVWKGEWQGTTYEDKGVILKLKPKTFDSIQPF